MVMNTDYNEYMIDDGPAPEKKSITIDELDQAARNVAEARKNYNDKKKISDEAEKAKEIAEEALINMMIDAGKTSYKLDTVGTISVFDKFAISNPSDPEEKRKFW